MSNDNQKKADDHGGINPVVAGTVGAVIGAGVAVAGTIAMQNPDNREKVKDAVDSVKERATEYLGNMAGVAEEKKEEIEDEAKKLAKH